MIYAKRITLDSVLLFGNEIYANLSPIPILILHAGLVSSYVHLANVWLLNPSIVNLI